MPFQAVIVAIAALRRGIRSWENPPANARRGQFELTPTVQIRQRLGQTSVTRSRSVKSKASCRTVKRSILLSGTPALCAQFRCSYRQWAQPLTCEVRAFTRSVSPVRTCCVETQLTERSDVAVSGRHSEEVSKSMNVGIAILRA